VEASLLLVGAEAAARRHGFTRALTSAGAVVSTIELPATHDRAALDAALDASGDSRLVLAAPLGDLAAVLRRLWRRGELAERETALLPLHPLPPFLIRCRLPLDLTAAATLAVTGTVRPAGLLADDSGGLVIDSATLRPWDGRRLWVRAVVDDTKVCDGAVRGLRVDRLTPGTLAVTVPGRLGRTVARVEGRAAQLACDEALLSSDGVARERPRRKRTWWNEPDLWRLALPS
jgi:hypothetical protein